MTDYPEHLRVFDPNAEGRREELPPPPPPRIPSQVLGEIYREIAHRLGNPPRLSALLAEYEEMTAGPKLADESDVSEGTKA